MIGPECPGAGRCYARAGSQPCRVHGCRVCGSLILADCEDWPAPLCIAHAPEPLIDTALALRLALERLLESCDGVHQSGCAVLNVLGRTASDSELAARTQDDGRSLCSCGYFVLRQEIRRRFQFDKRDTMRAPVGAPS